MNKRESIKFLLTIVFTGIAILNVYIVSNYDSFEATVKPFFSSGQQFSGFMVGILMLLTSFMNLAIIAAIERKKAGIDWTFITSSASIAANYFSMNNIVFRYDN